MVSLSGIAGIAAPCAFGGFDRARDQGFGREDARAVVDEDEIGRGRALSFEPSEARFFAALAPPNAGGPKQDAAAGVRNASAAS